MVLLRNKKKTRYIVLCLFIMLQCLLLQMTWIPQIYPGTKPIWERLCLLIRFVWNQDAQLLHIHFPLQWQWHTSWILALQLLFHRKHVISTRTTVTLMQRPVQRSMRLVGSLHINTYLIRTFIPICLTNIVMVIQVINAFVCHSGGHSGSGGYIASDYQFWVFLDRLTDVLADFRNRLL